MIRLDKRGRVLATNGFDGVVYKPSMASSHSVFFGDTEKSVSRGNRAADKAAKIKALKAAAQKRKTDAAFAAKFRAEKAKKELQSYHRMQEHKAQEQMRGWQMESALTSSKVMQTNPFVGNPLAGFGSGGEERINADSGASIELSDQNGISQVDAYGARTWMENQTSEYHAENMQDRADSETAGKQIMSTMVDTSYNPLETMINIPTFKPGEASKIGPAIATKLQEAVQNNPYVLLQKKEAALPATTAEMNSQQKTDYLATIAAQTGLDPQVVKWGIGILLAKMFLF